MEKVIMYSVWDRPEYTTQSLEGLLKSNVDKIPMTIVHDGWRNVFSTHFCDYAIVKRGEWIKVRNIIRSFKESAPFPVEIIDRPFNLGCNTNILATTLMLMDQSDIIIAIQDDHVIAPSGFTLLKTLEPIYRDDDTVFALDLSGDAGHTEAGNEEDFNKLHKSTWSPYESICLRWVHKLEEYRSYLEHIMSNMFVGLQGENAWEFEMSLDGTRRGVDIALKRICVDNDIKTVHPVISRVEHIGYLGVHMHAHTQEEEARWKERNPRVFHSIDDAVTESLSKFDEGSSAADYLITGQHIPTMESL